MHQSSLESHALAPSGSPGHCRRSALVRVSHPTDVGGGRHGFVTGQGSPRILVVEHQGVQEDDCPRAPTVLNIDQFMTNEETAGGVEEPHWFVAYSCSLQWVGEVAHRWKWGWTGREALEV